MNVPFDLEVRYGLRCRECGEERAEVAWLLHGMALPMPTLPPGWHTVDGRPVCQQHTVRVESV